MGKQLTEADLERWRNRAWWDWDRNERQILSNIIMNWQLQEKEDRMRSGMKGKPVTDKQRQFIEYLMERNQGVVIPEFKDRLEASDFIGRLQKSFYGAESFK